MKVALKKSCIIRPAETTSKGIMPLSEFDQIGVLSHVPTIYFYRPDPSWLDAGNGIVTTLTSSLSKALVYFYPLAGRIRCLPGGRFELDCNESGVTFTVFECNDDMNVLGDFSPSPKFHNLIPHVDYSNPVTEHPLFLVQMTEFRCGGISLGVAISHAVTDGQSALHFMAEWARLSRGEPIGDAPFVDRRVLRAGEAPPPESQSQEATFKISPPLIVGETNCEKEKKKKTSTAMLKLSKSQVETLKNAANKHSPENLCFSRYEAITAHLWRSTCRARRHVDDQKTGLSICVDIRNRMNPKLPNKFFGNAIVDVVAHSFSGELKVKPLSYAVRKIREAINSVTNEYVNSSIDCLKNMEDLSPMQDIHALRSGEGMFYGNPNLSVISWLSLPLYVLDFGFGREAFMGPGTHDSDGDSLLLPATGGDDDGAVVVAICLQDECMSEFKKLFYEEIGNYA